MVAGQVILPRTPRANLQEIAENHLGQRPYFVPRQHPLFVGSRAESQYFHGQLWSCLTREQNHSILDLSEPVCWPSHCCLRPILHQQLVTSSPKPRTWLLEARYFEASSFGWTLSLMNPADASPHNHQWRGRWKWFSIFLTQLEPFLQRLETLYFEISFTHSKDWPLSDQTMMSYFLAFFLSTCHRDTLTSFQLSFAKWIHLSLCYVPQSAQG